MIVVPLRLNELFVQLPMIAGFKPFYDWGDEAQLIKQIKLFAENSISPYPLIYQLSNKSDQDSIVKHGETELVLILACQNLEVDLLNKNRWAMSYGNILYPLVGHIETAFTKAGIFNWNGKYSVEEFPNYGNGQENKSIDIWDAILFKTKLTISGDCINPNIRF